MSEGGVLGTWFFEVVPLEDPRDHQKSGSGSGRSEGAILADLAVLQKGMARVSGQYGTVNFIPLSEEDPLVQVQEAEDSISKKAFCYQDIHARYLGLYARRHNLTEVLGYEMHGVICAWFEERLQCISDQLKGLEYY